MDVGVARGCQRKERPPRKQMHACALVVLNPVNCVHLVNRRLGQEIAQRTV